MPFSFSYLAYNQFLIHILLKHFPKDRRWWLGSWEKNNFKKKSIKSWFYNISLQPNVTKNAKYLNKACVVDFQLWKFPWPYLQILAFIIYMKCLDRYLKLNASSWTWCPLLGKKHTPSVYLHKQLVLIWKSKVQVMNGLIDIHIDR